MKVKYGVCGEYHEVKLSEGVTLSMDAIPRDDDEPSFIDFSIVIDIGTGKDNNIVISNFLEIGQAEEIIEDLRTLTAEAKAS